MRGKINKISLLVFFFTFLFTRIYSQTVPPAIQAFFNCDVAVPFQSVNLTGNPAGSLLLNVANRLDQCCTAPNNIDCKVIEFILDPNAAGVSLNPSGALAVGNVQMWVNNCLTPYTFGSIICLSGPGPHYFVFCKSGGNEYQIQLTSIPAPGNTGDITTTDGCNDQIITYGLNQSSITWTSISPGAVGQYNNYLTNFQGANPGTSGVTYSNQDSVLVNPQAGAPSSIVYRVCGTTIGNACAPSIPYCDDVTVNVVSNISVTITPTNPVICVANPTITANVSGGLAPYTYLWSGPSNNGATTSSIIPTAVGNYSVSVIDATGCPGASASTTVLAAPVLTGTANQINCLNQNSNPSSFSSSDPNTTYSWTNNNTNTGIPASGTGNLPSYLLTGVGTSTITVTPTLYGCQGTPSTFTITVNPLPIIEAGPDQLICANSITSVTATGANSYVWTPSVTNGVNFTATTSGTYSVTGTDGNGCQNTDNLVITFDNIPPTASNPTGVTVQCSANVPAPDVAVVIDEADNGGVPTVAFVSDVSDGNTCAETITRTYSVTDNCGNSINVTQTITIDDTTLPTASNPAPIVVQCSADVPLPNIAVVTDEADNCSTPTVAFVSDVSDGNTCAEIITRTYSVTDDCGNSINVTQTITIDDTTLPTASNPAPIVVQCSADVPLPNIAVVTDEADNCSTPTVAFVSDVSDGNTCAETITRTYSVTDNCGNSINVTQTITIDDTTLPTASNPAPIVVQCSADVPLPNIAAVTDEADNCSTPTVAFVSDVSDGNTCAETITRTYSVTDDCGNSINVTQTITIDDTTLPTASNPAPIVVQCSADVPLPNIAVVTDEADNCSTPTVAFVSDVSDGNTCAETITRTYSVTDDCGNSINVTQTITIDDTTLPTASNPAPIVVQCSADVPLPNIAVVTDEADNCSTPTVAFVSDVSDGNTCSETITRTYSVTDDCGNSINVTQTITIDDTTLPTASNPAPIVVQCSADVPLPNIAVVTDEADNCSTPTVAFVSDVSDGNTCAETITRTYSVTDDCGNSINVTQTITIDDTTLPTASNPAPIVVQCSADVPLPNIAVVTDEADNCSTPTVAFVSDVSDGNTCAETITRTYSVTDDCGNSINVTQTITIDDTTLPTASNPAPIVVQCSADVPLPNIAVVTDEADNCSTPTVAFVSDVSDGNTCAETITRTYSVTDNCGNSINVTQTITIDDTTLPTASNPAPIVVQCSADVPLPNIAVVTDEADNCSTPTVAFVSDVSDGNTCSETITRTYSVTDDCGNSINVTQTITIDDTTLPTASNPAPIVVQCSADVPLPNIAVVTDEADNCSTPTVAFVSDVSDGNTCAETITRTYSVTDNCGNSINVTQTITIDDTTLPTASNPAPIVVQCSADVPLPNIAAVTDEADNCSTPTVAFVSDVSDGNTCAETITRTYSVTDDCGNSINVTQTITIDDTTLPTASNPAPIVVQCSADVPLPNIAVVTDEADNCSTPTVAFVSDVSDGNTCAETITRTYSVTDDCGNSINVTQTITIDDTTLPTASNPAPIVVQCSADVPLPNIAVVTDEADNCSTPTVAFVSDVSDGNTCSETITRTYSVTDNCGNSINVTQTITIDDTTLPTASNPAPIVVQCSADVPLPNIAVVTDEVDNCSTPTVAFVSDVSDGNTCAETITRTYSVTDDCGNSINVTQTITVDDTTLPTASNPAPIVVQCSADVPLPNIAVVTDEADNCSTPTVAFVSDVTDGNTCAEVITRTYSVTDDCGNSINVTQTITVDDTTLPTASNPAPIVVQCSADVPLPNIAVVTDEADNCSTPTVAFVSDVTDGNTCAEVITRTYSVTDDCGNSINVTQTITIDDTTLPTASNPAPIVVQCSADVPLPNIAVVTDEADNCSTPTVAFVSDVSDGNTCAETITRTYSVTDNCGNSINVTQTITIDDTTLPTASNPAPIVVQCSADVPLPNIAVVTDEADNCSTPTVAFVSDVSDGNTCSETITRTYSVTDDCGNSINVTQTITIDDTTLPTASNPAPIVVQCSADVPLPNIAVVTDEADNCSTPTVAFVSDVSDGNTCAETITRTYSVTDDCGNSINVTQTITIDDTTLPTASNPAPIVVQCSADVPLPNIAVVTDEVDNCSTPTVAFVSDVSDGNTCAETITRTYSVTDDCGNSINVTQTITVDDTTLPTASNPAPIVVQCSADVPLPNIAVVTDEADNCSTPTVAFVSDVSDGNTCSETITRTYSVTDDCGNSINVTQTITIDDTTLPTASNPAPIVVQCSADVPLPNIAVVTDEADNCSTPTVAFVSDVSDGNTCAETITRTYSVTDNCGNSINVTQTITIDDTTLPTASNPAPIVVQCSADVPLPNIAVVTDEADNCSTPTVAFVSDVSDGNTCAETITRTYSVTDDCGNSINVTQTITIDDTTLPTASNPAPIVVQCSADVPLPNIAVVTDEADNCSTPTVAFVSDVSDGNTCAETITRTYSVTDDCGNSINVTQTITVDDTTLPTASNPATTTIPAGPAPAPDPTIVIDEADNCSLPTVAFVSETSDGGNCPETITRIYSVTDACGNTINVTHLIVITDLINPTASNPSAITVQCSADVPLPNIAVVTDEADNGGVPTVAFVSDVTDGNTCAEVITRTYSVTDDCGNSINVTQTITIDDTTLPTASNPAPIVVQCSADVPLPNIAVVTDEADNCSTPTVAFVSDVSDGNTCSETITRTYSVTDDCGNSINVTQTITIDDTTLPTASNPAPIVVQCSADVPLPNIAVVTDEADNCSTPTVAFVSDVSDGNTCAETITRTYSVTDDCGNSINVTQTITIDDTTLPTASNPAPIVVQCSADVPLPNIAVVTDEADNCSTPTVAFVSDVSDGNTCAETITRTYSVTDDCGNSINVTQTITIDDTTLPTASNPAPIVVQCSADVPLPNIAVVTDEADNCSTPTVAFVSDVSDGNTCAETITRTYSVTDNCGNSINVTQTITIDDTTLPTASNPAPIVVQCSADVPLPNIAVVTDEADNCSTPTVAFVSDVSDGNTCSETITRTYSVTDDCGNSINVTQTITIDDTTLPTASNPAPIVVQCSADVPLPNIAVVTDEADNCSTPTVAFVSDVSDGNTCAETITRTYSVTDNCGNSINVTQTITIDDTTLPTASNPAPIVVQCSADVPLPNIAAVTDEADNCSTPTVAFVSDVSDGNTCAETITRTYSVTDDCGNSINVTQTITIDDTTLPTASNPAPIVVQCSADVPLPNIAVVTDEADNCSTPTVAFVSDVSDGNTCAETITRTYSVTDDCGNSINVTQTITIDDTTLPTASNPAPIVVQCSADVPLPNIAVVTDEADNCSTPTVAFVSDVSDGNTCAETITRTYSVTDNCGNSINVTQTITIDDTTLPTASNPAPIVVQCSADVPLPNIAVVTDEADNCSTPTVAFVSDVSDGNTCSETITRTYSVTDDCGNSINVTQTITIDDTTLPTASNPAPIVVQCSADVPLPNIAVVTDEADNCSTPTVAFVSDVSDGNTCAETITRTYSVTDDCGNSINVTQTITIDDTTLPTASNPATTTIPAGPAPAPDPTIVIDEADNCSVPTVAFVSESSDGGNCPETITRIYSVTDNCGNTINVTHLIVITDLINPTASNPVGINVQCSANVPAPDVSVVIDEVDNGGVPTVAFVSDVSDGNTCAETITRTYSVTDDCGNSINVTQTITVDDTTPPTASNPAPIVVQCSADVPLPNIAVVTDEADNCSTPTVAFVSDVSDGNTCAETITRTYSVTDDCGNSINVTQTITIDDTTLPTASNPAPIVVQCSADVPLPNIAVVTDEADNCSTPTVAFVSDVSDGNTCAETITRTYSVTDDCGNSINVTQTITIDDTTLPTASNPAPIVVQCSADVPLPNIAVVTDEADNCSTPTVAFVSDVSDGNTCAETITRTYSVTDNCGNSINVTQTITVDDTTLPTASNPAPIVVQCSADVPLPNIAVVTDEADNCSTPTVAFVSDVSDGNTCAETITRTYSVTDDCGNSINVTQTITVDDTTPPTASNPAPIVVQCSADVPLPNIAVVTDEADNCSTPTVAFVSDVSDGNTCAETITRTYSVTDDCGNSINVTQTITIDDTTLPTASNPAPIVVQCSADVPLPNIAVVTDEADNCSTPTVAFVSDVSDGNTCAETITRTYSVTDDCGNSINVTQTITVDDTTLPTASNPAPIVVQCSADVPLPNIAVVTDEADNCSTPTVAFVSDVSDGNTCAETITRTYSVTDDCGNSINVTQTITVDDTTLPTASNPAPIVVQCSADVPLPNIAVVTDEADNCSTPTVAFVSDVSDGNTCAEVITRTYSVTDNCGNSINVTQTITVDDTTLPTASNPATTTIPAGPAPAPDPTIVIDEADNCSVPTVAFVSETSDGGNCPETITRIYSVTDACGNTINVTHLIVITDLINPTASNPVGINVQCSANVPAPDVSVVIDEADNGGVPTVAFVSDVTDGNTCAEVITRTYSVTDDCGNSINVTQTITIDDTTLPTASNPAPIVVQCSADIPLPNIAVVTDEADNCSTPTVAFVSDVSDGNTCAETITRTYSVTDDCGNSITVTQTITVDDTTLPTASNPINIIVECPEDIPLPDPLVVIDENDNCGLVTVTWVSDQVSNIGCPEITRLYSVTDLCGNSITVTQVIEVQDNIAPVVALQDTIFSVTGVIPAVDINSITGIQDNCISPPTVTFVQQTSSGTCPVIINRLFIVTDACGNSTDVIQTIVNSSTVNPIQANFSFYPQTISPINSTIQFINSSTGGNNYSWNFGDSEFSNQYEPIHSYDNDSECTGVLVTLIVSDGICSDTVTQVIPCEEETIFYVPNTFTPDGDNFNQTFYPVFYSGFDPFNFEMLIFDRWGELIFETHNVKIGWDGSYGNFGRKVQDGVYTWKITYKKRENDLRNVVVGHVTLIR